MKYRLLIVLSFLLISTSCFDEEEYDNSVRGNFEALWTTLDEKYCFFEYKEIDWDEVYDRYSARLDDKMGRDAFFDLMDEMLAELKDGHVNLTAPHDQARYWKWYTDYPDNFDEKVQRNYLGTDSDYGMAGALKYRKLTDNIGYVYYGSFQGGIGEGNLDQVLYRLATCDGLIIDVRNNGGGALTNSEKLANRFVNEKTLVGYIMHKTGKGHNDFSKPYEKYIEPKGIRFQKKIILLTNRRCYSATNDFVNAMRYAPNVTIVGDKTGGGSGLPFSSELPNGWGIRFSASPMLDAEKQHIEFGIEPDEYVTMTKDDIYNGVDPLIERARQLIRNDNNLPPYPKGE